MCRDALFGCSIRSSNRLTTSSAWKGSGCATVVSEIRCSPEIPMSSNPTTERCSGTDSPAASHVSLRATAPVSLEANRAVGASAPLIASLTLLRQKAIHCLERSNARYAGALLERALGPEGGVMNPRRG